jgi:hypothetical protein
MQSIARQTGHSRAGEHHEPTIEHKGPARASDRTFGLAAAGLLAALALVFWFRSGETRWWIVVAAAAIAVAAFVIPRALSPLNCAWMFLGVVLNRITSPVVLGVVYLVAFVPAGLVMRLTGRDALGLKRDRRAKTYWEPRPAQDSDMCEQF